MSRSMETLVTTTGDSTEAEDAIQQCPQCGSTKFRDALVKSTFWHDGRLVVVDDILAIVCESCGERLFNEATCAALDLMHRDGFPVDRATSHLHVAVFPFSHRVPAELTEIAESEE